MALVNPFGRASAASPSFMSVSSGCVITVGDGDDEGRKRKKAVRPPPIKTTPAMRPIRIMPTSTPFLGVWSGAVGTLSGFGVGVGGVTLYGWATGVAGV